MPAEMDNTNLAATPNLMQPKPIPPSSTHKRQRQGTPSQFARSKVERKAFRSRSEIWDHFTKFVNEQYDIKARCNYYSKDFYVDPKRNGTTAMKSHMNVCRSRINASDDLI